MFWQYSSCQLKGGEEEEEEHRGASKDFVGWSECSRLRFNIAKTLVRSSTVSWTGRAVWRRGEGQSYAPSAVQRPVLYFSLWPAGKKVSTHQTGTEETD